MLGAFSDRWTPASDGDEPLNSGQASNTTTHTSHLLLFLHFTSNQPPLSSPLNLLLHLPNQLLLLNHNPSPLPSPISSSFTKMLQHPHLLSPSKSPPTSFSISPNSSTMTTYSSSYSTTTNLLLPSPLISPSPPIIQ